jgi:hypothetical protein
MSASICTTFVVVVLAVAVAVVVVLVLVLVALYFCINLPIVAGCKDRCGFCFMPGA